jgi:hypothetical protein
MAHDQPVCAPQWLAHKKDEFTWVNSLPDSVIISQDGSNRWPFTLPSPIDVAGQRSDGRPGRTDCGILDGLQGPFTYNVYDCPNKGNPKTVIIS